MEIAVPPSNLGKQHQALLGQAPSEFRLPQFVRQVRRAAFAIADLQLNQVRQRPSLSVLRRLERLADLRALLAARETLAVMRVAVVQ